MHVALPESTGKFKRRPCDHVENRLENSNSAHATGLRIGLLSPQSWAHSKDSSRRSETATVAISLRRDEPYAMHLTQPDMTAIFKQL